MINHSLFLFSVFVLSLLGMLAFMPLAKKLNMVDVPNARSSHTGVKYRGGGLVFALVWFIALFIQLCMGELSFTAWFALFVPSMFVALTGFLDDLVDLSSKLRFAIYLLSSLLLFVACFHWGQIHTALYILAAIVMMLGLTWSINLFNFMDGTDGIAGTQMAAVLIFAIVAFWHVHAIALAYAAASLLVAIIVFLFFNWPSAKLFMGDVGSAMLGIVIGAFALLGYSFYHVSLLPWVMVYGLFCFDATVTLIRRLSKGHKWNQAHKFHAYQRLHQSGLSHRAVLYWAILMYLVLLVLALAALLYPMYEWYCAIVSLLALLAYYLVIEKRKAMVVEAAA